jgi:hypothetical protein
MATRTAKRYCGKCGRDQLIWNADVDVDGEVVAIYDHYSCNSCAAEKPSILTLPQVTILYSSKAAE